MTTKFYKTLLVTIIGSTRYEDEMRKIALQLQAMGIATYYPESFIGRIDNVFGIPITNNKYPKTIEECIIKNLSTSFKTMISKSDYVFVYNKDQYIGDHTKEDIHNTIISKKPLLWLEKPTKKMVDSLNEACDGGIDYDKIDKINLVWNLSIDNELVYCSLSSSVVDTFETNPVIFYGDPSICNEIGVEL